MANEQDTRLVLQISADIKSLENAMKRAGIIANDNSKIIEKAYTKAGQTVQRQSQTIESSMRQTQQATKNLGFQFSDVMTSLLSGGSPFTVAAQQAGQAGDAITELSKKGSLLKGLGGALAATFSPAALGVGAAILAFGTLVEAMQSYFSESGEEADKAAKTIKEQQAEIREIGERWKDTLPGVTAYVNELLRASEATQAIADKQKLIAREMEPAKDTLKDFSADIAAVRADLQAADFEQFGPLGDAISTAFKDLQAAIAAGRDPSDAIRRLQEAILAAQKSQVQSARDLAVTFDQTVMPVLNRVMQKANEIKQAFRDVRNPITDYSIGPGGMGMGGADEAAAINQRADALNSAAARLIKAEEGFITRAKWDENHFRVGFGSDTFVDDLGKVREVTESTVVTIAQANADLGRRIVEFQNTIKSQLGGDIWRSLEENQQAALTSIAYNYGNLPASIVKAIKQGDRGQVAEAIASLSANPERRQREAAAFGGSGFAAATRDTTRYIDEESAALDSAAAAAAKLLQEQRQLTPEQERLAKSAEEVAQQYAGMAKGALSGFISDLRQGVEAGEAFRNMLNRVIDGIINMAIEAMFAKNALGGVFGNLFGGLGGGASVAVKHDGGKVGVGPQSMRSGVNPAIFAGAPRLHNGLLPGEFPAILQKGEVVIPKTAARKGGSMVDNSSMSFGDITVNVPGQIVASSAESRALGEQIDRAVQAVLVREKRPGGLLKVS
ncbi:phage tail length tape measure family protein [Ensifer canadensis]|uniref:phage tail length tape measure family protein n=1 Tax=Ensifer canadensis TaxID=555315 RepID=UPI0035E3CF16